MNIKKMVMVGAVAGMTLLASELVQAEEGGFNFALGLGASFSPDYAGSDDYEAGALPFLSVGWQAAPKVPESGTGIEVGLLGVSLKVPGALDVGVARLYRPEGVYQANLGVFYNGGRDQDDNTALNGMGDIDGHAVATAGISFEAENSGLQYGLAFAGALGSDDNGYVINGEIGYEIGLRKNLSLTPSFRTTWADKDHMQTNFGVTPAQAATSVHSAFKAESGIKSIGIGAELGWAITDNWMVNTSFGYSRLTSDAADSPLVKNQGSANQFEVMTGLIYKF